MFYNPHHLFLALYFRLGMRPWYLYPFQHLFWIELNFYVPFSHFQNDPRDGPLVRDFQFKETLERYEVLFKSHFRRYIVVEFYAVVTFFALPSMIAYSIDPKIWYLAWKYPHSFSEILIPRYTNLFFWSINTIY